MRRQDDRDIGVGWPVLTRIRRGKPYSFGQHDGQALASIPIRS
jgi:hypothetical protein